MVVDRIRRQVYLLTEDDLEKHPVWEYALDEEGEEDQDEATVRPVACVQLPKSELRLGAMAATAKLRDGREVPAVLSFYVSSRGVEEYPEGVLHPSQPRILVGGQHHGFWHGILKPRRGEMDSFYAAVGSTANEVFPIEITARITVEGEETPRRVVVTGFQYLADPDADAVGEMR